MENFSPTGDPKEDEEDNIINNRKQKKDENKKIICNDGADAGDGRHGQEARGERDDHGEVAGLKAACEIVGIVIE